MTLHYAIHNMDAVALANAHYVECIFADSPDNIGLEYCTYEDSLPEEEYVDLLEKWIYQFAQAANTVWLSYNAKWTFHVGRIVLDTMAMLRRKDLKARNCVQVFTFGQHNKHWLGNNHRPLLCMWNKDAVFYPDHIRVPSWRLLNGDPRANPAGKVPNDVFDMQYQVENGDVFDFPRVTGNSKQRRHWCPTQLHEDLVKRCIEFSTKEGDFVLDPFAGTGTTLRVCKDIGRSCATGDIDLNACKKISEETGVQIV
jgi:hypothetical protein